MRSPCFATLKPFINQRRRKKGKIEATLYKTLGDQKLGKKKKKTNKQTNITTIVYNELEF
jgi:hypothetical protein